jgi:signal transduction histidine kinase
LSRWSLAQLEEQRTAIDTELQQLARYSLRSGMGAIGYRSKSHPEPDHLKWIQIDLEPDTPIDQIVLVPAIWRDYDIGFRADGFPLEFRVLTGNDQTTNTVAVFSEESQLLPRIAPLVIDCPGTVTSWVRLEATRLSVRAFDGRYNLEIAELLAFNGNTNVALHRPVHACDAAEGNARKKGFLTDGFMPYLMDAAHGEQSSSFIGKYDNQTTASITIDLQTTQPLDSIHLHSIDLGETIPLATPSYYCFPRRLLIEGALTADFSDAIPLMEYYAETVFDTGPIIMHRFPETQCRYIRLTALEPYIYELERKPGDRVGFAEIELFANGQNVALDKPVTLSKNLDSAQPASAMTDGRNLYGDILPIRSWLNQLARRHELETERPRITAELNLRYARQKTNLQRMGWLATLLAAGIAFTLLISRMIRLRQMVQIKERFAADLHDELGANIHTIGLLSDFAQTVVHSPDQLIALLQRIRSVSDRTGTAIRHCSNMLEADDLYLGLIEDMRRASQRITAKFEHDFSVEGESFLNTLKPRTRVDLFLFYKECLTNIYRHSGATRFSTQLIATPQKLQLTVSDNGKGIDQQGGTEIPAALKRRARLLKGKLTVENPADCGTKIMLTLRLRKKYERKN